MKFVLTLAKFFINLSVTPPCDSALQVCLASLLHNSALGFCPTIPPCNAALWFCPTIPPWYSVPWLGPAILPNDSALWFYLSILLHNSALWFCPTILPHDSALWFCPTILPHDSAPQFYTRILPSNSALQFCLPHLLWPCSTNNVSHHPKLPRLASLTGSSGLPNHNVGSLDLPHWNYIANTVVSQGKPLKAHKGGHYKP